MQPLSKLDTAYRSIVLSKFFGRGWGKPDHLKRLFQLRRYLDERTKCAQLLSSSEATLVIQKVESTPEHTLYEGYFKSPLAQHVPDIVPPESHLAHFQILEPSPVQKKKKRLQPLCLHLAGTGDHYFWRRRRLLAKPLLKEANVTSIILENPFYGLRRPQDQVRSSLHHVSDIFVMGGCLCLESHVLLKWAENNGFGPLAITGISMGGHMASIAGCQWNKPLALVPCLSWTTASTVFTTGVMSEAVPWRLLENQYKTTPEYCEEVLPMLRYPYLREGENISETFNECLKDNKKSSNIYEKSKRFMTLIMDECTHLAGFPQPVDPNLAVIVAALHDAYVPSGPNVQPLDQIWPGSELRHVDYGHVAAFLLNQAGFRRAIVDALEKTAQIYYGDSILNAPEPPTPPPFSSTIKSGPSLTT